MGKQVVAGVVITTSGKTKTGNKHKWTGRNNRPSRQRYWSSGRLEEKKVRNLIRCCGYSRDEARTLWRASRKGRVKK